MPRVLPVLLLVSIVVSAPARATETVRLMLQNHQFSPNEVTVPAGEKFRIEVVNNDTTPEEFESHDLKIEKIVPPGGKISVTTGPLKPGKYHFVGEYHEDSAYGMIIAVKPGKE